MDGQQGGAPRFAEVLDRAWTQHSLKRVAIAVLQFPAEANGWTTVVHATVETDRGTFSAIGDASPESVAPALAPHAIRVAETRALARALRWATNTAAAVAEEMSGAVEAEPAAPPPRERGATGDLAGRSVDQTDRKSTRLNSSHTLESRMPSSA